MNFSLPLVILFFTFNIVEAQTQDLNKDDRQNGVESGSEKSSLHNSRYKPHYVGSVELGFLYGKVENPWMNQPTYLTSASLLLFNGYQFHRLIAIGAATGLDFYEHNLITPLGLGIRGSLLKSRVSPFYSLDGGYGFTFLSGRMGGERPEGGWFFNPAIGLRVSLDNKTAFLFGLGYKEQRIDREFTEWWGSTVNQRITYKRLSLRVGFLF